MTPRVVLRSVHRSDWFTSVDLKDAYFLIHFLSSSQEIPMACLRSVAYEFLVLPFCLAQSLHVFTRCPEAALLPLRQRE